MEGLIPMLFRKVKKNRIRSQYSMLSPDSTAKASNISSLSNYNIADFYVDPPASHVFPTSNPAKNDPYAGRTHRRFNSFGGSTAEEDWRRSAGRSGHGAAPSQLVRFRSQRILSCLTGQPN